MITWLELGITNGVSVNLVSPTLNSQWYCYTIVYPFIAQLKEDEIDKARFQQDGTTAHTAHMSLALLDEVFANRIIFKII